MNTKGEVFYITGGNGFHVVFPNGYAVSVQFGPGNYCDNHDRGIGKDDIACGKEWSRLVETAVWGPDGKMITLPGDVDTVQGYRTVTDAMDLLRWAESQAVSVP